MSYSFIIGIGLAAVTATVGCSDPQWPAGPRPSSRPAALAILHGDGQTGTVATTLGERLVVRVTDRRSRPVENAAVHFLVLGGGGSIAGENRRLTDSAGIAGVFWSLGKSTTVPQLVEARISPETSPPLLATFRASARPASAAAIEFLTEFTPDTISAPSFSDTVRLRVTDAYGNRVPEERVAWSVPNGGSLEADSTATDSDGTSTNRWTLRSASGALLMSGAYSLTATLLGTFSDPPVAVLLRRVGDPRLTASSISLGAWHSCAIAATGGAWCWGLNTGGQLGDGTRTSRRFAHAVASDQTFRSIAAGAEHTCALNSRGQAFCWGNNGYGQLGDGTRIARDTPVLTAGGRTFASLAASSEHTCGVTHDGSAYCWGANADGRLGDGTAEQRLSPTAVATSMKFASLVVGLHHTCGLNTKGETMCWGSNEQLQLGAHTRTLPLCNGQNQWRCSTIPVTLRDRYVELAANRGGTCGLTAQGALVCWGWGLTETPVMSTERFGHLTGGSDQTCGITNGHSAFCWAIHSGGNDYGDYGTYITEPERVPGSFIALRIGADHFCGITAGGGDIVRCWGSNPWGQLGDGSIALSRGPTSVLRAGRP